MSSIRLTGIVRSVHWKPENDLGFRQRRVPFLTRTVISDARGNEIGRIETFLTFGLFLEGDDDGIVIEIAPNVRIEPSNRTAAKWKDVTRERLEKLKMTTAKSPPESSAPIEITHVEVNFGAHVALLAQDAEYIFLEPTKLRETPERRITRVTAHAIAVGDDASTRLEAMLSTPR